MDTTTSSIVRLGAMHAELVDAVKVVLGEQPNQRQQAMVALQASFGTHADRLAHGLAQLRGSGEVHSVIDDHEQQQAKLLDACTALVLFFNTVVAPFFKRCLASVEASEGRLNQLQERWGRSMRTTSATSPLASFASRHCSQRRFLDEYHPNVLRAVDSGVLLPPQVLEAMRCTPHQAPSSINHGDSVASSANAEHCAASPRPAAEVLGPIVAEHLRTHDAPPASPLQVATTHARYHAAERLKFVEALHAGVDGLAKCVIRDLAERLMCIREQTSDAHDAVHHRRAVR